VGMDGISQWQARLTFAMARHVVVDISQIFSTPPRAPRPDRLPPAELIRLRTKLAEEGLMLREGQAADEKLSKLRHMYEPYVYALSRYLVMPLPPWMPTTKVTS